MQSLEVLRTLSFCSTELFRVQALIHDSEEVVTAQKALADAEQRLAKLTQENALLQRRVRVLTEFMERKVSALEGVVPYLVQSSTVIVHNYPASAPIWIVREFFLLVGHVRSMYRGEIVNQGKDGDRALLYVQYSSPEEAKKAVELLNGATAVQKIKLQVSLP